MTSAGTRRSHLGRGHPAIAAVSLQAAYMIVDEMHEEHPELLKDQYWEEVVPKELPYTVASEHYRRHEPPCSADRYKVKAEDALYANVQPPHHRKHPDDTYADYVSTAPPRPPARPLPLTYTRRARYRRASTRRWWNGGRTGSNGRSRAWARCAAPARRTRRAGCSGGRGTPASCTAARRRASPRTLPRPRTRCRSTSGSWAASPRAPTTARTPDTVRYPPNRSLISYIFFIFSHYKT